MVDYFIKWVETEPLAYITETKVIDFVWKSIICHFRLSRVLIINNGHQFVGSKLDQLCEKYEISHHFTSVAYPQTNEEAEVTNRTILQGLK